jgi:hypothetical protein
LPWCRSLNDPPPALVCSAMCFSMPAAISSIETLGADFETEAANNRGVSAAKMAKDQKNRTRILFVDFHEWLRQNSAFNQFELNFASTPKAESQGPTRATTVAAPSGSRVFPRKRTGQPPFPTQGRLFGMLRMFWSFGGLVSVGARSDPGCRSGGLFFRLAARETEGHRSQQQSWQCF